MSRANDWQYQNNLKMHIVYTHFCVRMHTEEMSLSHF